ncbi:bestrophin family protein [Mucilaginibacter myungsuensis]|uniref:Bestrophin family protein n=1 Tax=Mucilaginibacter myungsuensis TaxID=649104 RepID=A0A929L219_9SPHI|nr:bestrophin family protein [Mucilaginibacter myungsuensis]MBE9662655.1 bestrophin family protein [Mucilaginibacter myungsuensis]MDN3598075.1 bestrophin family protein [Mucilaginibacter myungsuensis]
MIDYNPKSWFTFIFRIHRADTFRKLAPLMMAIMVYSAIIVYLEVNVFKLAETSHVKNISLVHTILSFVISMLLVFRTNTAYDRWWEGRRILGSLTNTSRNLAIKLNAIKLNGQDRAFFAAGIPTYANALRMHLREERWIANDDHIVQIDPDKHVPNQIAAALTARIYKLHRDGIIAREELLLIGVDIASFTDIIGACERIKTTPIPFSYSVFIKKFIFFFVMTLPYGWSFSLGYLVVPLVAFVLYVLASLELIAEEIEDPFGYDANDLPVDRICTNIQKHVREVLG